MKKIWKDWSHCDLTENPTWHLKVLTEFLVQQNISFWYSNMVNKCCVPNCKSGYVYKDASNAPPPSSSNLSFHSFPIDPGVRQNICYKPCFHLTNILSMSFVTTINFCFYFKCAFVIMLMTRPTISLIFAWKKHFFSHY